MDSDNSQLKLVYLLGLIASVITILVFVTGSNLPDFLSRWLSPKRPTVVEEIIPVEKKPDEAKESQGSEPKTAVRHKDNGNVATRLISIYSKIPAPESSWYYCSALSPDGRWLALGTLEGPVLLWDLQENREFKRLARKSSNSSLSVAFIPQTELLVAGYHDDTAKIWNFVSGSLEKTLLLGQEVRNVIVSPDGSTLITNSRRVTAWDTSGWVRRFDLTLPGDYYGDVLLSNFHYFAFSPDGRTAATAVSMEVRDVAPVSAIRFWDLGTGTLKSEIDFDGESKPTKVEISHDGRYMAWIISHGINFSGATLHAASMNNLRHSSEVKDVENFGSVGDHSVVFLTLSGSVMLWDLATGQTERLLEGEALKPENVFGLDAFDHYVVVRWRSGGAYVWKLSDLSG